MAAYLAPSWQFPMTSQSALVHQPELDAFLFASIGEERNGMALTVVSALARLGLDPWTEAGRLSQMSRKVAADLLGLMIAKLPNGLWTLPEAQPIAARLVTLLPQRPTAEASAVGAAVTTMPRLKLSWILCGALAVAALIAMAAGRDLSLARILESPSSASSGMDRAGAGDR